jgi:hypothetical protein
MNKLHVDATQTLRALSLSETEDVSQRWFVVQLVTSDRAINLDMMPHLEVFDSYRLYTVTGRQDDGNLFALRLGFFSDDLSANAICGYLKTFFAFPTVMRVSAAEHGRFAQPAAPPKAAAANPTAANRATKSPASPPPAAPPAPEPKAALVAARSQKSAGASKSLAQQLLDEAREVQMSRSGRHRVPTERSGSWISRLLGLQNR